MNVPLGIKAISARSGPSKGSSMSGDATPREPDGGGRGGRVLPVPGVAARPLGCAEIFLGFMTHGPIAVRFESPIDKHARQEWRQEENTEQSVSWLFHSRTTLRIWDNSETDFFRSVPVMRTQNY